MKFIVDNQLPPALAAWLSGKGYEAQHVSDIEGSLQAGRSVVEVR